MAFERATPPALRWVLAFLGLCAVLGVWLGFKDQIRRNPPAWYTGAPEPVAAGAVTSSDGVREATAFDPDAKGPAAPATTPAATAKKDVADDEDNADAQAAAAQGEPASPATVQPSPPAAATPTTPATPRPRPTPAPAPARPAPSDDPVGDLLEAPRPSPQQPPSDVPY